MKSMMKVLAFNAHGDQKYGDYPYSYHLISVVTTYLDLFSVSEGATKAYLEEAVAVCWGHDLIEDTYITKDDLLSEGFSVAVVDTIELVTKTDLLPYKNYLRNLSRNKMAWQVKVADTYVNMTESIIDDNFHRVKKYSNQLNLLYKYRGQYLQE